MYKHVPQSQGLMVTIKTKRKGKHGKSGKKRPSGEGRKGRTGVVAKVYRGSELIGEIARPTFRHVSRVLRKEHNISPSVKIAKKGKTYF